MFAELLRSSPLLAFPIIGLGLFATLFAAVIANIVTKRPDHYRQIAQLPLERDGEGHVQHRK